MSARVAPRSRRACSWAVSMVVSPLDGVRRLGRVEKGQGCWRTMVCPCRVVADHDPCTSQAGVGVMVVVSRVTSASTGRCLACQGWWDSSLLVSRVCCRGTWKSSLGSGGDHIFPHAPPRQWVGRRVGQSWSAVDRARQYLCRAAEVCRHACSVHWKADSLSGGRVACSATGLESR